MYNKAYGEQKKNFKDEQLIIQLLFLVVSTIGMLIPYNNMLKLLYEGLVIICLIIFVLKKPSLVLPILFLTTISPIRSYSGLFSKEIFFITFDNEMIIAFTLLGVIALKLLIDKFINIKRFIPLYIILFIFALSYFYTDDFTRTTYYTSSFWIIVLTYAMVPLFVKTKNDLNVLLQGFALAFIQNAFLIIIKILDSGLDIDFEALMNRNYYSLYIVIIMVSSLIYVADNFKNNKIFNVLIFISFIPNVIMLFLLSSRSAFIIFIVSVFLYLLLNIKNKKIILPISLALLLLLFFINNFDVTEVLFDRFQQDDVSSGHGRVDILVAMLDAFGNRTILEKVFGTGFFATFVDAYGLALGTHNSFLSYLMHFGLIGFICFVILFLRNIRKTLINKDLKNYFIFLIAMFIYCFVAEPHIKTEFILIFIGIYSVMVNKNNKINSMDGVIK